MQKAFIIFLCAVMIVCTFGCADSADNNVRNEASNTAGNADAVTTDNDFDVSSDTDSESDGTTYDNSSNVNYSTLTGQVVKTDSAFFFVSDGSGVLLSQEDDFAIMLSGTNDVDFSGLVTGDCVQIRIITVVELYPLQTDVYELNFLNHGSKEDISSDVISEICNLGYNIQD
ncbi:MAG: hypothetical protein LUH59_05220 [Firmicutes bacterium]|nr:hypothetical protein [Bacillota bacterium]